MNKYAAEVQYTAQLVIQAETKEEAQKKIEAMLGYESIMETCEDSFWGINYIDSMHTYDEEADRFIAA